MTLFSWRDKDPDTRDYTVPDLVNRIRVAVGEEPEPPRMLDPKWTPERGYSHAAAILAALARHA